MSSFIGVGVALAYGSVGFGLHGATITAAAAGTLSIRFPKPYSNSNADAIPIVGQTLRNTLYSIGAQLLLANGFTTLTCMCITFDGNNFSSRRLLSPWI